MWYTVFYKHSANYLILSIIYRHFKIYFWVISVLNRDFYVDSNLLATVTRIGGIIFLIKGPIQGITLMLQWTLWLLFFGSYSFRCMIISRTISQIFLSEINTYFLNNCFKKSSYYMFVSFFTIVSRKQRAKVIAHQKTDSKPLLIQQIYFNKLCILHFYTYSPYALISFLALKISYIYNCKC